MLPSRSELKIHHRKHCEVIHVRVEMKVSQDIPSLVVGNYKDSCFQTMYRISLAYYNAIASSACPIAIAIAMPLEHSL